jgi:hypothetical protein
MQSYLSDLLGRERIADFRRDAERHRLATVARAARRRRGNRNGTQRPQVAYRTEHSAA